MTGSEIEAVNFDRDSLTVWAATSRLNRNWPVVYTINNENEIYVGETTNAELRMKQHLQTPSKSHLANVNVIVNESFNKSVCLDLESHLIKYFHADEKYKVLNGNGGITDSDYFDRDRYRESFEEVFQKLLDSGQLTRSIPELVNTDLFKYSPFKALTTDQAIAVEEILEVLFSKVNQKSSGATLVVQGDPGTGKTIVAVYLIKLLRDIATSSEDEAVESDSLFADFFQTGFRETAANMKIGLVVPQLSLRETLSRVFSKTPGLSAEMVLDPFQVGESVEHFDLLIVDEAHRLQQRNNQPAAARNIQFKNINEELFGVDDISLTQLDWIKKQSKHQIYLLDQEQSVKPADLPKSLIEPLVERAQDSNTFFRLTSQMRVAGGEDYIAYIREVLQGRQGKPILEFGSYEVKFFDEFSAMHEAILARDAEFGLSRMVAGFAWPWVSRNGEEFDFLIDGIPLVWNRRSYDWINSATSSEEVGSIHTVQGYDLNYAAVIIGPELGFDQESGRITFHRENYHDKKGKENNKVLGRKYTDEDLLAYVTNIYRVLMTRGIKGTYIYVVEPNLRVHLRQFFTC